MYLHARRASRALHAPWESTSPHRPTPGSDEEFNRLLQRSAGVDSMWIGLLKTNREAPISIIGQVSIMPIQPGPAGSAYTGYWVNAEHAGKGFMREMLALTLDHAFRHDSVTRIEANIIPTNSRSLTLVRSLHFRYEGTALEYLEIDGRMQDHEHHALLAREWFALDDDPLSFVLSDHR